MKQRIKAGLAALVLSIGLAGPAAAGQLEDGIAADKSGDYATALSLLRPLAGQGDATALDRLGMMYSGGRGVPKDQAEGLKWFRMAAELGNAHAMRAIGTSYEYGWGVLQQDYAEAVKWYLKAVQSYRRAAEKGDADAQVGLGDMYFSGAIEDHAEAVKWYRKAAEQGAASAQGSLGIEYYYGRGVQRNYAEAAKWYRKAAEQGDVSCQKILGDMYFDGRGVPQDYVQAYKWFYLAAASYTPAETESRDKALKSREIVAHKMTPPQLAEAQRLSAEWKPSKLKAQ